MTDTPSRAFLFRHREFGLFWAGMGLVNLAVQIEAVTIGWQIYAIARETRSIEQSAFLVGMVGLAQFLPLFVLTLIAGSTADRTDRRRIVLITLGIEVLCVLALLYFALDPEEHLSKIFGVAAIFGAARAFQQPAASAIVPMLVPRSDMPQAISLKSLAWQGAVIIGPWIGGLLVAASTATAYGGAAVFYAAGLVLLLTMRADTRPVIQPGGRIEQIREGLVYVWTNKIVFGAISLDLVAVLLGGATALLPAFASDVLGVGPEGFGILRSGPAIGAAAVALALSRWPLRRRAGVRMFWSVAAFGLATLVFALSRNMVLSVVALAALGAADMVSVYVRQTLVQIVTPDHLRGRVSAVSGLFVSGSNELGEFESGVVARLIGPVGAAAFGGIGTLAVTGLWARMFPDLRRADRLDGEDAATETSPPVLASAAASTPAP
ncbi:MFS transporter [Pseudoroseicyclus aestuarii]|uniref:Transmembrane secretion effector n=1 Tax=Pseudoroseicyclus aestuarii TaxID=1795041 RepID=A0A318SXN8_9RHOB|nr:MFS transporter [Pseudoroseicyclus aestuarii]PYE86183.1 transmembrane secretion effector [Pseudoroseicyclus aestuarii]